MWLLTLLFCIYLFQKFNKFKNSCKINKEIIILDLFKLDNIVLIIK